MSIHSYSIMGFCVTLACEGIMCVPTIIMHLYMCNISYVTGNTLSV